MKQGVVPHYPQHPQTPHCGFNPPLDGLNSPLILVEYFQLTVIPQDLSTTWVFPSAPAEQVCRCNTPHITTSSLANTLVQKMLLKVA